MHRVNQDNATMITQDDERKIDRNSSIELLLSLINQYGTVERFFPSRQSFHFSHKQCIQRASQIRCNCLERGSRIPTTSL